MIFPTPDDLDGKEPSFLLALHSSTETFGVAVLHLCKSKINKRILTFPVGRALSKKLLSCVEELLPSNYWSQIARLAVAIGPGGFTGTRLSVVMARTLAQQIGCPLDGVNSFSLMVPRLSRKLSQNQLKTPFWVYQSIPRRGVVAGRYQLKTFEHTLLPNDFVEIVAPSFFSETSDLQPRLEVKDDVEDDVRCLLEYSIRCHSLGLESPWTSVLPIYPTSPVDNP